MATISVRVTPRASSNRIELGDDGSMRVYVTAAATNGQANKAVIELIAKKLHVAKSAIVIIRGESSRNKSLEIASMALSEIAERFKL
jgi:uncharacterized protein (TIGR00251 family)